MFLWAERCFDGVAGRDATLVRVDGGHIAAVEHCAREAVPEGTATFDGATLLPGLVDAHQHLVFDASADPVATLMAEDDEQLAARVEQAARRALTAGITTIRDLGDRNYVTLALRDGVAAGAIGPTVVASGPPITITQGHCWFMGGEADGVGGVRKAVRDHVARGVDVIKVMATGGNMTPTVGPHESQYDRQTLTALVDEAHRLGRRVAAHAHGLQGVLDSVRSGADTIEHCSFMSADGVDDSDEAIEEIARRGTVVSVTFGTLPGPQPTFPGIVTRMEAMLASRRKMLECGVRLVVGTDAGITPAKPHDVLPHAVTGQLASIGMPLVDCLVAVTSRAAEACGVGGRKGAVLPGYDADLLVVGGDLLADPTRIHDVRAVYAAGRPVR